MQIDRNERAAEVLRDALDDAWHYRLGEASSIDDPDLDPGDREYLLRYEALLVMYPELAR